MSTSVNPIVNTDPFGLWMMKPTKAGGAVWYIYNTDFNDDPQVFTESVSNEYLVHNIEDADGTRFTISASDTFKTYISSVTGYNPASNITDQQEMTRRGYMQDPQDWRNVEFTGQFVVFKEADDFITFGFRTGKHTGSGSPAGCNASSYLVEINMKAGGLVRVRKKSWNTSIHNWLSALASGFDATKVCGWTVKILVYNTQDGNNVNVELWLAPDNDNRFTKILSGTDTGQINTDANVCNCTNAGQPIVWGGPFVLIQGNTGTFGFKNISIREIEGYGATLPPVDPGSGSGGSGTPGTGTGGGGGTGSGGTGGGGTGGGGGVPVDLTPVLATPKTSYVEYGGGPQFNPLEFHFIFAGSAWNQAPATSGGTGTGGGTTNPPPSTSTTDLVLATPKGDLIQSPTTTTGIYTVYSGVSIHFIFWGSQWNTQASPNWTKNQLMTAMQNLFQSSYFEGLIQYDIKKPKIGSIVINTTYATVTNFDEIDIMNVIVDSVNHGQVPDVSTTNKYVYYVIGAKAKHGASSYTSQFLTSDSFHHVVTHPDDGSKYVYAYTDDHNDVAQGNLATQTNLMSSEIVNVISNPAHFTTTQIGAITYDATNSISQPDEIGDLGGTTPVTVNTVSVYKYWSDEDNAAIAPSSKPSWISCPTGYSYDPVTQTCQKLNAATTPTGTTSIVVADPVFDPAKASEFRNQGGMATNPLDVYLIWWGSTWNSGSNKTLKDNVVNDQITVFNSTYFDACLQYGMARRPKFKKSVTNTTYAPVNNYNYLHVHNCIVDSVNKGLVPAPTTGANSNITYIVISDPSKDYDTPGVAGEHRYQYVFPDRTNYLQDPHFLEETIVAKGMTQDDINEAITHELVETITDPAAGWILKPDSKFYDNNVAQTWGFETVDVCEPSSSTRRKSVAGVGVAGYWSDQDNACVAPTSKPAWIKCPSGYTYDSATQTCTKTVTNPNPTPTPTPNPTPTPTPTPTPQPSPGDTGGIVANTTLKTQTQNAITSIFNSTYFTGLYQYGLTRKPTIGSFTVNSTSSVSALPNQFTHTQLEALIADSIAKGAVPAASSTNNKIVHFVITPPRIFPAPGQATGDSYAKFGDSSNTWYKIQASATLKNNFDDFTRTISYISAQVVAQQNYDLGGKGYHMKIPTGNATVDQNVTNYGSTVTAVCWGDTTNDKLGTTNITVAKYWSDQDGACIIPVNTSNPTPWAACHTGAVFDNTTQSCKLQPTSGGGGTTPPGTGGGRGYAVVLANATDDDGNVPANAIDGKLDTRWSAFGKGQFLRLDFGTPKRVDKVKIAWYQGDKRSNDFEITTAENQGDPFVSKFKGKSQQGSTALQDYSIPLTNCRYIRIVGYGNTQNDWVSISEVEAWGPDVASSVPGTGSGGDPGSGGTTPGGDTGGGTSTSPPPPVPVTTSAYNFFDTSFSLDFKKIGMCNPVE